jgi:hypothetical protein
MFKIKAQKRRKRKISGLLNLDKIQTKEMGFKFLIILKK